MRENRHSSRRRGQAEAEGFSLVEVTIAMGLLAIALTSFVSSICGAQVMFQHQRLMTEAVAVSDVVTEQLLIMDGSDDDLTEGIHARYFQKNGRELAASPGFYTVRWTVSSYDEVPGIRQIVVRTSWAEKGTQREVRWTTFRN